MMLDQLFYKQHQSHVHFVLYTRLTVTYKWSNNELRYIAQKLDRMSQQQPTDDLCCSYSVPVP